MWLSSDGEDCRQQGSPLCEIGKFVNYRPDSQSLDLALQASVPVRLMGNSTVVPPHQLPQDFVLRRVEDLMGHHFPDFERRAGMFANAGINRRYAVQPLEWYEQSQDFASRSAAYIEGAERLFVDAARSALASANVNPEDVGTVVTVSSTGVATPTLEARTHKVLGFSPSVRRVPLFGLGCAGGVTGLALAARLARATPGSVVLLVCVELCTTCFRKDDPSVSDLVASALFGDGAAAVCLQAGDGRAAIHGEGMEHLWPDTLDIMGWSVETSGLRVIFDRSIPKFTEAHYRDAVDTVLEASGIGLGEIDRFICHPGGAKVIEAIEQSLDLDTGTLDHERDVLADYGNLSAPTVLFVLDRVLKSRQSGTFMLASLGPGFTASFLPLRVAA